MQPEKNEKIPQSTPQSYDRESVEKEVQEKVRDMDPLLIACLSILLGVGISVTSCTRQIKEKKHLLKKIPVAEQKVISPAATRAIQAQMLFVR